MSPDRPGRPADIAARPACPHCDTPEHQRLEQARSGSQSGWYDLGPYLAERQWGTVREDYSADGDAWAYFSHEDARRRAYRWGEDGLAGFSDAEQRICLALALWNGRDPILKERLFGLTNSEGNHGEDVKEIYYYLDATPTHSYMRTLYKYPHQPFPYQRLSAEGGRRSKEEGELELADLGVFDDDRYFDVVVEYAKADPHDLLMRVTVHNRGPEPALLHVLPQFWFRNTWSWQEGARRPRLARSGDDAGDPSAIIATHETLGEYRLSFEAAPQLYFCDNDTRPVSRGEEPEPRDRAYFKDAFHRLVVEGEDGAVNPAQIGTKAAAHYVLQVASGGSSQVRLRLRKQPAGATADLFSDFDAIVSQRQAEADAFHAELQSGIDDPEARRVQRQALAGMIWSKQFYYYDVSAWLRGDPAQPAPPVQRLHGRNSEWDHLNNADIISMPDKWEYPWYAAWDSAFHCLPLALVDAEFAKQQLVLLTREWYMHPNGQLPAYEWNFSDVNPPVHAWATWRVFQIDRKRRGGTGDLAFLERVFHKLLLNFTWWVNRKDAYGHNIFQGGFLGLDNIGVFDRSRPLPTGGRIDQADGTAWMAMYSLQLMRIALELSLHNPVYQDIASKFFEHFLHIAEAMTNIAGEGIGLWDEEDAFYYDVLNLPDGQRIPLKVRSLVGLLPLCAVETLEPEMLERVPEFHQRLRWFLDYRPDLAQLVSRWHEPGRGERRLLSLLRGHRMKCLLRRMLDESEFLSDFGVRSLSRHHLEHPYVFHANGEAHVVRYRPAESDSYLFGGNSNWRGPIWFPVNYLLIESLQRFHHYYGPEFQIECPSGSGRYTTLAGAAAEVSRRLCRLFLLDARGKRPIYGHGDRLSRNPRFRDHLLLYEYFDGDSGRGLGASHQTGWTGLVAKLLMPRVDE